MKGVKTYFASLDDEDDDDDDFDEAERTSFEDEDQELKVPETTIHMKGSSINSRYGMGERRPSMGSTMSGASYSSSASSIKTSANGRRLKRVRVAVRCRPALEFEEHGSNEVVSISNNPLSRKSRISVKVKSGDTEIPKAFQYDEIFGPKTSQQHVYEKLARPIVEDVLQGYNGAIMAYGQTGTGKTYTMGILDRIIPHTSGKDQPPGIIPGALHQIFEGIAKFPCRPGCGCSHTVSISFLQIYLESLQDLLATMGGGYVEDRLTMREDPKTGFYVQGLHSFQVKTLDQAVALINLGLENRRMACTSMNASSSRSHTVLTIDVVMRPCTQNAYFLDANNSNQPPPSKVSAKLRLIDLAGSERVKVETNPSTRVQEAKSINVSLSALGNVVAALAQRDRPGSSNGLSTASNSSSCGSSIGTDTSSNSQHIPFRDSKLTRLLQDTLGGKLGANTALIATIGPSESNVRETISTLKFASRCMRVRSEPTAQREVNYANLCANLQNKLENVEKVFMNREDQLRRAYEREISQLKQQIQSETASDYMNNNYSKDHSNTTNNTMPLLHDMYASFMDLGREYRVRLEQQRASLEAFVFSQLPGRNDLNKLKTTLRDYDKEHRNIARQVCEQLGIETIEPRMLEPMHFPKGTEPKVLALHSKVATLVLRIEAQHAHNLLNRLMDELISLYIHGAKRDEDLVNCSHVLKYLLKTNEKLRSDLNSTSTSPDENEETESEDFDEPPPPPSLSPSNLKGMSQLDRYLFEQKT